MHSGRIAEMLILSGDLAIRATAFTAVSLVISFLSLSTKMGKQLASSLFNKSPRLAMICPMQVMARSFTS